jgi:hypothetical protein
MAIHEGDANRRLASQAVEIYHKLFQSDVPTEYKKEFEKLLDLIEKTLDSITQPGIHPARINGIKNSTAAKYIKLLIDIEYSLKSQEDQG